MKARYILTQEIIGTYGTMSVPGSAVATHRAVCPNPHVTALPGSVCVAVIISLVRFLQPLRACLPGWGGAGATIPGRTKNCAHETKLPR